MASPWLQRHAAKARIESGAEDQCRPDEHGRGLRNDRRIVWDGDGGIDFVKRDARSALHDSRIARVWGVLEGATKKLVGDRAQILLGTDVHRGPAPDIGVDLIEVGLERRLDGDRRVAQIVERAEKGVEIRHRPPNVAKSFHSRIVRIRNRVEACTRIILNGMGQVPAEEVAAPRRGEVGEEPIDRHRANGSR